MDWSFLQQESNKDEYLGYLFCYINSPYLKKLCIQAVPSTIVYLEYSEKTTPLPPVSPFFLIPFKRQQQQRSNCRRKDTYYTIYYITTLWLLRYIAFVFSYSSFVSYSLRVAQ